MEKEGKLDDHYGAEFTEMNVTTESSEFGDDSLRTDKTTARVSQMKTTVEVDISSFSGMGALARSARAEFVIHPPPFTRRHRVQIQPLACFRDFSIQLNHN